MKLPLEKRIKRRRQLEMARMQDVLVDFVVSLPEPAVFHGGTAIWRIYGGRRFSEDLDFYYVWENAAQIKESLESFIKPFDMELKKFKSTGSTIFSDITRNRVHVKLEFSNQKKEGIIGNYERVDGTFVSVYVLPPEEIFKEKVNAFLSRWLVRDLYDLITLYPLCDKRSIRDSVIKLKDSIRKPRDMEILRTIVIDGVVPSYEQMRRTVMRW